MPEKLKRTFEREYEKKGLSKKNADRIFYSYENKHGLHYLKKTMGIKSFNYPEITHLNKGVNLFSRKKK